MNGKNQTTNYIKIYFKNIYTHINERRLNAHKWKYVNVPLSSSARVELRKQKQKP